MTAPASPYAALVAMLRPLASVSRQRDKAEADNAKLRELLQQWLDQRACEQVTHELVTDTFAALKGEAK